MPPKISTIPTSNRENPRRNTFDPQNYEYKSFEEMLNYALDYIQKCYPDSEVNIDQGRTKRSFVIKIGNNSFLAQKAQLQIFSFLARFEGKAISVDDIINYGLSENEDDERDISHENFKEPLRNT